MAWYDTLNIPSGLEELFAKVLQLKPNGTITGIGVTLPQQNHARAKRTSDRSPVVLLHPYWLTCTSLQKLAWQSYWSTLPYGTHVGAGGWPGSGFSAFVHVNASRLKAGLDILLDPPVYANLVPNGNFAGNADGWGLINLQYVASDLEMIDTTQPAECTSDRFALKGGHTYRVSMEVGAGTADVELSVADSTGGAAGVQDFSSSVAEVLTFDFVYSGPDFDYSYFDCSIMDGSKAALAHASVVEIA